MLETQLDGSRINEILNKTLEVISNSKNEIFEIAENTRKECELIEKELEGLKNRAKTVIEEVDQLIIKEKRSRARLLVVSKNFDKYTEEDIKEAYEVANNLRIALILKRQEEKDLIQRRKDLELRLKNAHEIVNKAERLVAQVGIAMEYLSGNLGNIIETIEDMQKRQLLGIKIIQAQEEERHRVARDIHDGPAQSLANVVIKAEICERLMKIDMEKAKEELKNLKQIVRNSLKDVRRIIYDLRPMSLDDLGLIPTVQRYTSKFMEETGMQVNVILHGNEKEIDSIIEIAVFRIIQEALNNIRKHSKATLVDVKIEMTLNTLNVVIEDNGVGFDIREKLSEKNSPESGFGLMGMRERTELLGGKINIKSSIGEGTKIIIMVPIEKKEGY